MLGRLSGGDWMYRKTKRQVFLGGGGGVCVCRRHNTSLTQCSLVVGTLYTHPTYSSPVFLLCPAIGPLFPVPEEIKFTTLGK